MFSSKNACLSFLAGVIAVLYSVVAGAQTVPTACTRIDQTPFWIRAPGTYCLTQNLVATGTGISIDADDVTIDLSGYRLRLQPGMPGSLTGIRYQVANIGAVGRTNLTIKNGMISGFSSGIVLIGLSGVRIENLRIEGNSPNSSDGIYISESPAPVIVRDNQIFNVRQGMRLRNVANSLVDGNVILLSGNTQSEWGIYLDGGSGTVVSKNVIRNSSGFFGVGITVNAATSDAVLADNVMSSFWTGISSNSIGVKYKNNTVTGARFPYSGGTNIGGNN